jgi:hypothetical protein
MIASVQMIVPEPDRYEASCRLVLPRRAFQFAFLTTSTDNSIELYPRQRLEQNFKINLEFFLSFPGLSLCRS